MTSLAEGGKMKFEERCFDGQKCGAITTGCLVGQCLRNRPSEYITIIPTNETALLAELDAAKRALELLYDKWENGLACYEDGDPESGFVGNAFKLTEEEENQILALIPALPSAALAAKSTEQNNQEATVPREGEV